MSDSEKRIKIFTLDKEHETIIPLIEETFKSKNIPIEIKSKYDTAYDGIYIGQKGLADIYVMKKDVEESLAILQDLLNR